MKKHEKNSRHFNMSVDESSYIQHKLDSSDPEGLLPASVRSRLYDLFGQIEREFETLYAENMTLQGQIEVLKDKLIQATGNSKDLEALEAVAEEAKGSGTKKHHFPGGSQISQRLKMTYKQQTSRLVSSFRQLGASSQAVRHFRGHRDGVWDVSSCRADPQVIGTASADHSARVWWVSSGACLLHYTGHTGSVNSLRFHPTNQEVVLTASGDHTAHIWKAHCTTLSNMADAAPSHKGLSSEDEMDGSEKEEGTDCLDSLDEGRAPLGVVRQPSLQLDGHTGAVIAADWMAQGSQVITASWDRSAQLYDAETGDLLQTLAGHDQELTYVCGHAQHQLAVTCSKDTTFRLWDFRDQAMKVNVAQGHSQQVTSAVFAGPDRLVSGSDDRTCKVWDLRNMRSPLTTIRTDSAINRISVHIPLQRIAVPHDNRHIRIYDFSGERLVRLPRSSRQGHNRMVCSVAWCEKENGICSLLSCGFDRQVIGWQLNLQSKDRE